LSSLERERESWGGSLLSVFVCPCRKEKEIIIIIKKRPKHKKRKKESFVEWQETSQMDERDVRG
jgi:hypothetical protein